MVSTEVKEQLAELTIELEQARKDEAGAKKRRVDCERAIIDFVGFCKSEGQQSYTVPDDAPWRCKVVIKQPVSSRFNSDDWPLIRGGIHPDAQLAVRAKYEIDTKVAREVQKDMPKDWFQIAKLLTRTPGKISVVIQEIENAR